MTRPESHQIDERAKRVFASTLPDTWVPREQNPDYRIDYTVEIFEGNEPSGLFWHVQLKGVKKPTVLKSTKNIPFSMEVAHLKYFIEKVPLPVFLVVVDTQNEIGWWVFLQRYIQNELKYNWQEQATVTIHLPSENRLADSAKIQKAVTEAIHYMRELNPSSIEAALSAEKRRLEELDPRFEIDVTATQKGTNYLLKPKQGNINPQFNFKGNDSVEKAKELVEAGGRFDFVEGEVEVEGMVDGWLDGYELISLESNNKIPAMVRFSVYDKSINQYEYFDIHGELIGGTKRWQCNCELAGGLIKVKIPLDREKTSTSINLEMDQTKWIGLDVKILPHLDSIFPFFKIINREEFNSETTPIQMDIFVLGNRLIESKGDDYLRAMMQCYGDYVTALYKARLVARDLGLSILVPPEVSMEQIHYIDLVYNFLKDDQYSFPAPQAKSSLTMPKEVYKEYIESLKSKQSFDFSTYQEGKYPFLTTEIDPGPRKVLFSSMKLDNSLTVDIDSLTKKITLIANKDCICTIQKCTDFDIEMLKDYRNIHKS